LAEQYALGSVAFPAISTGVYGYPADQAAHIAVGTVTDALLRADSISKVIFCCFSASDLALYQSLVH
jgi:O-acetyl-ADP-ribose deacetylase (regulator of RNase III)